MSSHVLLIEDEPNIAEAIRFILSRDGWHVSTLMDGSGAMAMVEEMRPDLVILDLMLPGLSGLDILEAIRALPDCANLDVKLSRAAAMPSSPAICEPTQSVAPCSVSSTVQFSGSMGACAR